MRKPPSALHSACVVVTCCVIAALLHARHGTSSALRHVATQPLTPRTGVRWHRVHCAEMDLAPPTWHDAWCANRKDDIASDAACAALRRRVPVFADDPRVCEFWSQVRWAEPLTPPRLAAARDAVTQQLQNVSTCTWRALTKDRSGTFERTPLDTTRWRLRWSGCELAALLAREADPIGLLAALRLATEDGRRPLQLSGDSVTRHLFFELITRLRGREHDNETAPQPVIESISVRQWQDMVYVMRELDDVVAQLPYESQDPPARCARRAALANGSGVGVPKRRRVARKRRALKRCAGSVCVGDRLWAPVACSRANPCVLRIVFQSAAQAACSGPEEYSRVGMATYNADLSDSAVPCGVGGTSVDDVGLRIAVADDALPAVHLFSFMWWEAMGVRGVDVPDGAVQHDDAVDGLAKRAAAGLAAWDQIAMQRRHVGPVGASHVQDECGPPPAPVHRVLLTAPQLHFNRGHPPEVFARYQKVLEQQRAAQAKHLASMPRTVAFDFANIARHVPIGDHALGPDGVHFSCWLREPQNPCWNDVTAGIVHALVQLVASQALDEAPGDT